MIKIKFWGVRGSFPTCEKHSIDVGGHTSCVEVRTENNEMIIFDMGTGFINLGKALLKESNPPNSGTILLSHYHWDHIFGFLGFAPFFNPANTFNIYGKSDKKSPKEILEYILDYTFWPVDLSMLNAKINLNRFPDSKLDLENNISISSIKHGHPNGANSYRLQIGGKIIVYSTDCEHPEEGLNPNVIKLAQNADLLIHDAQYTEEELQSHKGWGHSSWNQAVEVAKSAKVKNLALYHHDPDHTDEFLNKVESEAQSIFPNAFIAKQNLEISI